MRAVVLTTFGEPEVLSVEDVPVPEPGHGQIRVKIAAIGVNPMDGKIRSGAAFFPVVPPVILGREFAGVVDAAGPGVDDVRPGDRVVGLADRGSGTYAEYAMSSTYVTIPAEVSFDAAVTVPVAAGTALRVLDQLDLTPGEVLVINGASGAVGSMAVQFAVQQGVTVVGTAGPSQQARVADLGGRWRSSTGKAWWNVTFRPRRRAHRRSSPRAGDGQNPDPHRTYSAARSGPRSSPDQRRRPPGWQDRAPSMTHAPGGWVESFVIVIVAEGAEQAHSAQA